MKFSAASLTLAALSILPSVILAIDPIVVKGTKFFYQNGTQFYIQGVAYQPAISNGTNENSQGTFVDPLGDVAGCKRDIPLLQKLNINVIRTYAIDTSLDHSGCINAFATAGIYIVSDLSAPGESINRDNPSWTVEIFQRYISVIDEFAPYPNVLGYFAGNEVSNNNTNTGASAFVKAAVRDVKAYMKTKGYRQVPVGYAANDDADIRSSIANYFACAPSNAAVDFYGINIYEWCGNSSFQGSGYSARTQEFSAYPVPVFFSEYGCIVPKPRVFTEVQAIYSTEMTDVWSGGIVYEYFQETNNYGLVTQIGSSVSPLPDYTALSLQLNSINPTRIQSASYTPTNTAPSCPTTASSVWMAATSLPPTPNQGLCDCAPATFGCAASPNLSASNISSLFGYICGDLGVDCSGINANGNAPGRYGAFSPCNASVKLSWLMNKYYNSQNKVASACNFGGAATTRSATAASGTCSELLSQAGAAGTGQVTSTNGVVNGGGSGGSGSGSSGSSGSSSAASGLTGALGDLRIFAAVVTAFLGGVALVVV